MKRKVYIWGLLIWGLIFSNCTISKQKKLKGNEIAIYQKAFDSLKTTLSGEAPLVISPFSTDQDRSWFYSATPKQYKHRLSIGYSLNEPYLDILQYIKGNRTLSPNINLCFFSPIDKNNTIVAEIYHNVPLNYVQKKRSKMPYFSGCDRTMYCFFFDKQNKIKYIVKSKIYE